MSENLKLPLVSIVTPSYNQGGFIRKCIESVLNQNYTNIEYIIIDGGSTDNTIDIIKEYEGRVKWVSERDNGQSDAINKGFKMANGEIVAWLNSDDFYEDNAVSNSVKHFLCDPELVLTYGEGYSTDETGLEKKRFHATQDFDLWTLVNVWDYILQPTTFFKKSALEKVDYLDSDLNWCMDWDLWIRLAKVGKIKYISEYIANSREYGDTKTSTGGFKRLNEIKEVMKKYSDLRIIPGYYLYALSTMYTSCKDIAVINKMAKSLMAVGQRCVFSNIPVRYKDGWIKGKYSLLLSPKTSQISFSGKMMFEDIIPLKIKIVINGIQVDEILIDKTGDFRFDFNLDEKYNEDFLKFTLKLNRLYRPKEDGRKLSIVINEYDCKLRK